MPIRLLPVDDGAEEEGGGDKELGHQAAAAAGHRRRLPAERENMDITMKLTVEVAMNTDKSCVSLSTGSTARSSMSLKTRALTKSEAKLIATDATCNTPKAYRASVNGKTLCLH